MDEQEFLQQYDITQYERPSLTADIVLFALDRGNPSDIRKIGINGIQVLLIRRATHPHKGKWALPGGFCQPSETILETAKRELLEETNVKDITLQLTGTYSRPDRDPRGWIISNAFMGMTVKEYCDLRADTDAWEAAWFTISNFHTKTEILHETGCLIQKHIHTFHLIKEEESFSVSITEVVTQYGTFTETLFEEMENALAFDHGQIIGETFLQMRNTLMHNVRPIFNLFPETFTLGELCRACELTTGMAFSNFRRTINPYVIPTDDMVKQGGYRPARLFRRNLDRLL